MLPGGTASVIGALHRKIWLPLFHPVTAWEACTGTLTYRPQRTMFTLAQGGMGAVAQRLLDRVRAAPEVTVHDVGALHGLAAGDGDEVVLLFEDGTERTASRPVLGVGADELFAAAGIEHRGRPGRGHDGLGRRRRGRCPRPPAGPVRHRARRGGLPGHR